MLAEAGQFDFLAQRGGEGIQRFSGVVLAAVEAAVNQRLDATAQGLEERGDEQGGGDNGKLGVSGEVAEQGLQADDSGEIEGGEHAGKQAIHQHAVDDDVNVVELRAQNGDADGYWDGEQHQWEERIQQDLERDVDD